MRKEDVQRAYCEGDTFLDSRVNTSGPSYEEVDSLLDNAGAAVVFLNQE